MPPSPPAPGAPRPGLPLDDFVAAARGLAPADLVLRNARVVNVLSGEIHEATVGIRGDRILGFGDYRAARRENEIDLEGAFLAPGLWDAHLHVESTMVTPVEFARLAAARGTAAVVTDPHEIANVRGLAGVEEFLSSTASLPVEFHVMVPSCVPATHLETSGAELTAGDVELLLGRPGVLGLAEVMNVPGLLGGDPAVRAKIEAARRRGAPVDGHAPTLSGLDLNAYAGTGIRSDHECVGRAEALEKLRLGMSIWIREGTAAKNFDEILPLVTPFNASRFAFVTDDRHPWDLLAHGHVDYHVRRAIRAGLEPVVAFRLATLSPARHYGFADRGAIAAGFRADLVSFASLADFRPDLVVLGGRPVSRGGALVEELRAAPMSEGPLPRIAGFDASRLAVPAPSPGPCSVRVIEMRPGQIVTGAGVAAVPVSRGSAVADPARDVAKLAVVERHRGTGNVGVSFVRGFGLARGAIASSVAHDSHNVVVVGADDLSMETAVRAVASSGGGIVVALGGSVLAELPLPVAGLMSNAPIADVDRLERRANEASRSLGTSLDHPFMTLAFLALPVVPALKLTDRGLVDVGLFDFVPPLA